MKRHVLILVCVIFFLGSSANAQNDDKKKKDEDKSKFKENVFFGGSLWASFGTVTRVEVSPVIGYHISPRFDVGIGGKYLFYKSNSWNYTGTNDFSFSAHIYGGKAFSRIVLIKNLNDILPFTLHGRLSSHLEYEGLNMPSNFAPETHSSRFWSHYYWVGGGLQQKIGKKAYFNIFILYNLNEKSTYQLYDNPTIRIGINF